MKLEFNILGKPQDIVLGEAVTELSYKKQKHNREPTIQLNLL